MMKSHLVIFLVTCIFCWAFVTSDTVSILPFTAPRHQIEILLAFKNEFASRNCDLIWNTRVVFYAYPNISSWTKDAYSFDGVSFDNETGAVLELTLRGACISGTIQANSSLFRFQHLRYLDLSFNHIDASPFPAEFGRLTNLEFLYLNNNGFMGQVPSSISKLSRLKELGLSYNKLTGRFPNVQNLTLFSSLDLSHNMLTGRFPNIQNLTLLSSLDLSHNMLTGRLPNVENLTLLSYIKLSYNHFSETIPSSLFTMPSLVYLDVRQNHLRDPLENMSSSATSTLTDLDMANNLFSFRILEPISKLPNLTSLDLSFQNTTYPINFSFCPSKSLQSLYLSGNSVSRLNTCSTTLTELGLSSCNITEFPMFIKTLRNLEQLDISENRLEGKVPAWLWNLPLVYVNLSHNSLNILEGSPKVLLNSSVSTLDLSSNTFNGSFPMIPPTIWIMAASNNNFTGDIPLSLCNQQSFIELLDLSNNNFSGSIPPCFTNLSSIVALKLRNNNLSGKLPDIRDVGLLDVGNNQISGKLPRSLVNCTSLKFVNVENNRISDTFPFWLKALPDLQVVVLRSNRFHGPISSPENTLPFPALRIIDISHNNFSGILPPNYFANWSAPLVNIPRVEQWPVYTGDQHSVKAPDLPWDYPSVHLKNKGRNVEFEKIQEIYTAIDFSGNRFQGQIPESIGHLKSLMGLDLSDNSFTGHIPSSLANLKQLESLDLSRNQLSGKIPQELRVLTFLAYLNISHNKLTGQIPQSTQIVGQPESSFEGNLNLCGLPLQESCVRDNGTPSAPQTQEPKRPKQEDVLNWKAAAIGYGPGVLFGLAIGHALALYKPVLFYKLFRL